MYSVFVPEAVIHSLLTDPQSASLASIPMRDKRWGRGRTWIVETRKKTDIRTLVRVLDAHTEGADPLLRPIIKRTIDRCHSVLQ